MTAAQDRKDEAQERLYQRVRKLVGPHLARYLQRAQVQAMVEEHKSAEGIALALALREPVGAAVAPLKADAMKRAGDEAAQRVAAARRALEAAGWDLNVAEPLPADLPKHDMRYQDALGRRDNLRRFTRRGPYGQEHVLVWGPDLAARHIQNARELAAQQYDMFTVKLVGKAGPIVSCTLEGSHVWGYSTLTVTKRNGTVEHWRTQQIVNVSSLGNPYPQWPTRRVRG